MNAERAARGANCRQRFVSMLKCGVWRTDSQREIQQGLRCCAAKLAYVWIDVVSASSLSHNDAHRPWHLQQSVCRRLWGRCQSRLARPGGTEAHGFRLRNELASLDSSVIDPCPSIYDTVAKTLKIRRKTIMANDLGHHDHELFVRPADEGLSLVTCLKDNTVYPVAKNQSVPRATDRDLKKREATRFRGTRTRKSCSRELRRVRMGVAGLKRVIEFLNSHFRLAAATISAIYKDRGAAELLLKVPMRKPKIDTVADTSATAVKAGVQRTWLTMLILRLMQRDSQWT